MLKARTVALAGRDAGREVRIAELPALAADRHARAALHALGEDVAGGVVALALRHAQNLAARGQDGLDLLMPFIDGQLQDAATGHALKHSRDLKDWRSISRLQQFALLVHVDFLVGRELLEVPVALQADQILRSVPQVHAKFCSAHIAAVLESRLATYRELETVLSTEDVFNLVEIVNASAIREWHAHQKAAA